MPRQSKATAGAFSTACRVAIALRGLFLPLPVQCASPARFSRSGLRRGAPAGRSQRRRKPEAGRKAGGCVSESWRPASGGRTSTANHAPCCPGGGFSGGTADCGSKSRLPGRPTGESIRAATRHPAMRGFRHGPGNGGGDDGRVALNPPLAATAGNVCFAHHRFTFNFPPGRGAC